MAEKLKNLHIKKVDFVDEGANPEAYVTLYKSKEEKKDENNTENVSEADDKGIWKKLIGCIQKAAGLDSEDTVGENHTEDSDVSNENELSDNIEKAIKNGFAEAIETFTESADARKGAFEVKIDKSKLTPKEVEFLEDIEKRYGQEEAGETDGVAKNVENATGKQDETQIERFSGEEDADGIYKGIHPAVKAQIEELKKFKDDAEEKELYNIAKKYALIGKKEEELVPILKNLKAAGGTAYNDMIAILDTTLSTMENSGVFSEIGKSGGADNGNGAWAKAEAQAIELMKSRKELNVNQAIDEVFKNNPELLREYEEEI